MRRSHYTWTLFMTLSKWETTLYSFWRESRELVKSTSVFIFRKLMSLSLIALVVKFVQVVKVKSFISGNLFNLVKGHYIKR